MYQLLFFITGYLQMVLGFFLTNRPLALWGIFITVFTISYAILVDGAPYKTGGDSDDKTDGL